MAPAAEKPPTHRAAAGRRAKGRCQQANPRTPHSSVQSSRCETMQLVVLHTNAPSPRDSISAWLCIRSAATECIRNWDSRAPSPARLRAPWQPRLSMSMRESSAQLIRSSSYVEQPWRATDGRCGWGWLALFALHSECEGRLISFPSHASSDMGSARWSENGRLADCGARCLQVLQGARQATAAAVASSDSQAVRSLSRSDATAEKSSPQMRIPLFMLCLPSTDGPVGA